MAWARVDDQFPDHPKIVQAGPLASWLHTCAICYCSRYLTDGFVPLGQVRKLADVDDAMALAQRLVAAGLWEPCDGGFMVHDYLDYNPPREKVLAEREAARQRMQGKRSGEVPANNERTEPELRKNLNGPVPTPVPVPVPTPETQTQEEKTTVAPAPAREAPVVVDTPYSVFAEFLAEIGTAEDEVAPAWKKKQLGIAKQLLEQGYGAEKVRRCVRYMRSQSWRTSPFDLAAVREFIGTWEANGCPAEDRPRGSPNGKGRRGGLSPGEILNGTTDLGWIEARGSVKP